MTIRVWHSERRKQRKILTAVIDVENSSKTGKAERFYYEFYTNDMDERRINVNGSEAAYAHEAWKYNSFWQLACAWKKKSVSLDVVQEYIDGNVGQNV
jgi:hypothetical protein